MESAAGEAGREGISEAPELAWALAVACGVGWVVISGS